MRNVSIVTLVRSEIMRLWNCRHCGKI